MRYQGTVITDGSLPWGDVVAICDVDRQIAEKAREHYGGKADLYEDYREILDRKDIDVVTIGAPGNGERWMKSKRSDEEWAAFEVELAADRTERVLTGESRRVPYIELAPPGQAERAAFKTMYRPEDVNPEGYPLENIDLALAFHAEDFAHLIAPRPWLLVHGIDDTMVRFVEAQSLFERAGEPKKLFTIPDINHADVYEARNPEVFRIVAAETVAWFSDYL